MEEKSSDKPLALITGASSGVGYELAKQFAENSFDLLLVSKNPAIVEAAQAARTLGAEVESYVIDLGKKEGVEEMKEKIALTGRSIEALAINTGMEISSGAIVLDEMEIINANLISSVLLCRHILKSMIQKRRGKILFTSSVEGKMPESMMTVYRASRAFVETFADGLRSEVKSSGITITELFPYALENHFVESAQVVATKAFASMINGLEQNEGMKNQTLKVNTGKTTGDPAKLKH